MKRQKKSYSQVLRAILTKSPVQQSTALATTSQKSTMSLVDEYTDRKRLKCNLVIHSLPESQEDNLADGIISDIEAVRLEF